MRKRNKKHIHVTKQQLLQKSELTFRYKAILAEDKHEKLTPQTIDVFKSKFNATNQRLEQGTGTIQDVMFLNGIIGILKIISSFSDRLSIDEALYLYMTSEPTRKEMTYRYVRNRTLGYKDDEEIKIVHRSYNTILQCMENMTNYQYDEFIWELSKYQKENKRLFIHG